MWCRWNDPAVNLRMARTGAGKRLFPGKVASAESVSI